MPPTLKELIQTYLDDQDFHTNWANIANSRNASIPKLQAVVERFLRGESDMKTFRQELDQTLHQTDHWGATGTGWLMELNKLAKFYDIQAEEELRSLLADLNSGTLGDNIELFYGFAAEHKPKLGNKGVNPGNSAFIVSLFAFWIDQTGWPPIYYLSLRRGLRLLLDNGLLPKSAGLRLGYQAVDVRSAEDHHAVVAALVGIRAADPRVATDAYWAEKFLGWVNDHPEELIDAPLPPGRGTPPDLEAASVIDHAPLAAVPEHELREWIAELRSRLLVDQALVRRIYHALLAGHVILTGPPGTGKTELARLLPELLWQRRVASGSSADPLGPVLATAPSSSSAYTTQLVTASDEWSVRTLIGGLAPVGSGKEIGYHIQYGHLTQTLFDNWAVDRESPAGWSNPQRKSVRGPSAAADGAERAFRGRWLVIDEFNRAPIDLALGDALTALGGTGKLRVPTADGSAELPLPKDFRIIGTLNSFDRNYLNQISEALKRRFAFIEVPPPTRQQRAQEQAIVLARTLAEIAHLDPASITIDAQRNITWTGMATLSRASTGTYTLAWADPEPLLAEVFRTVWNTFEIIRIYRQLGTAQALTLLRQLLIAGVVQQISTTRQWLDAADQALTDTVADQLQLLLPDELEVLIDALTLERAALTARLNQVLLRLVDSPRRLAAQISALNALVDRTGSPLIALDEEIDQYNSKNPPQISEPQVAALFNRDGSGAPPTLPLFTRRLRSFKLERGL